MLGDKTALSLCVYCNHCGAAKHTLSICFYVNCETKTRQIAYQLMILLFCLFSAVTCKYADSSWGFSVCSLVLKKKKSADFLTVRNNKPGIERKKETDRWGVSALCFPSILYLPSFVSQGRAKCVLRLCIRLRFQRSHTVPCFLVGSPGNKSAEGTLLWEAYGKEHMHVQPWGYITMYNNG